MRVRSPGNGAEFAEQVARKKKLGPPTRAMGTLMKGAIVVAAVVAAVALGACRKDRAA